MPVKASTGLRNGLMVEGSFKSLMDSSFLKIYAGAEPASADAPPGVLLCTMTNNSDGTTPLTFAPSANDGVLQKNAAESWAGAITATGTASHYRLELAADDQLQSDTHKRVQGTIGTAGADMNLTSVALVLGGSQNIDYYSIVLPTN